MGFVNKLLYVPTTSHDSRFYSSAVTTLETYPVCSAQVPALFVINRGPPCCAARESPGLLCPQTQVVPLGRVSPSPTLPPATVLWSVPVGPFLIPRTREVTQRLSFCV